MSLRALEPQKIQGMLKNSKNAKIPQKSEKPKIARQESKAKNRLKSKLVENWSSSVDHLSSTCGHLRFVIRGCSTVASSPHPDLPPSSVTLRRTATPSTAIVGARHSSSDEHLGTRLTPSLTDFSSNFQKCLIFWKTVFSVLGFSKKWFMMK